MMAPTNQLGKVTTLPISAPARAPSRTIASLSGPRLLLEEVSNGLLSGIRRRRWSGAAADASHGLLLSLPVRFADDQRDRDRAWELARRYDNHPTYDMIYVALAERTTTELVTADDALRRRLTHVAWIVAPDQAALNP
jgi:predicted nucleic acid-binding protein